MTVEREISDRQNIIPLLTYRRAVVVGVGGIGSWVALNLAMSGKIGELIIIDPDTIESSNLNRTPFRLCDIGYYKVDALKYLILERRIMDVNTFKSKTCPAVLSKIFGDNIQIDVGGALRNDLVIIDCRDDVYDDMYKYPVKYYKIGYDGLEITIDGNPRETSVWGRSNGYRFTPSFICPAQLAANIVVTDILTDKLTDAEKYEAGTDKITNRNPFDHLGRFNKSLTFNCKDLLETLYRESISEENG